MKHTFWILAGLIIGIGVIATVPSVTAKYEEPAYTVLKKQGNIEMREYSQKLIAKVNVTGTREEAASKGFRAIADYIFGNNEEQNKIAMTVPVLQERLPNNDTMNNSQLSDEATLAYAEDSQWIISFVMPSMYTMENIPKPVNDQVTLEEAENATFITLQFSGGASSSNLADHKLELDTYIKENSVDVKGEELYAFYNAPWTPPFMRRNEVMYRISRSGSFGE